MTQPTNSIDSELEEILGEYVYKITALGYDEYGETTAITEALQAIKALYVSRKEIEEAIDEVEKPILGLKVIFRSAVFYELRAKLLPPTKGDKEK